MRHFESLVIVVAVIASSICMLHCGSTTSSAPAPETTAVAETVGDASADSEVSHAAQHPCLPLANLCGCTWGCAEGLEQEADERWLVTPLNTDLETIGATLERWCFDESGSGTRDTEANASQTRCTMVFVHGPCGGECIPTNEHLDGCDSECERVRQP